ncbi:hypothetical protein NL676_005858 [Syzygium grande]|nr:hypothetical protein NL676_005858 [Syzygium grande]
MVQQPRRRELEMARGRMNLVQTIVVHCLAAHHDGRTRPRSFPVVERAASSEQKVFGELRKRGTESEAILKQQAEEDVPGEISTDSRGRGVGGGGGGDGRQAVTAATPQGAAPWPNPRRSNPPKHVHGEQVAAGWPSWLSEVVGEAINGWTPRRADTFEKLDKEYMVVCSISEQKRGIFR